MVEAHDRSLLCNICSKCTLGANLLKVRLEYVSSGSTISLPFFVPVLNSVLSILGTLGFILTRPT